MYTFIYIYKYIYTCIYNYIYIIYTRIQAHTRAHNMHCTQRYNVHVCTATHVLLHMRALVCMQNTSYSDKASERAPLSW